MEFALQIRFESARFTEQDSHQEIIIVSNPPLFSRAGFLEIWDFDQKEVSWTSKESISKGERERRQRAEHFFVGGGGLKRRFLRGKRSKSAKNLESVTPLIPLINFLARFGP